MSEITWCKRINKAKSIARYRNEACFWQRRAARLMQQMLEQENFLTEEELEIYKRGRNSHTVAKMQM